MSLIDKFKNIFESAEQAFADYKLEDGTIVRAEALEAGNLLEVIAEDGTISNAPEGSYILEDGMTISVDAESLITEVIEAVVEEEIVDVVEEEMEEVVAEVTEEAPVAEEVVDEVTEETPEFDLNRITELEDTVLMIMEKLKAFEDAKGLVEAEMSALKIENEALKSTVPSKEAVKFKKIDPSKVENKEVDVKRGKFAEFIAQNRKK